MAKPIPIENIYYLLCYAWDKLDEGELAAASHEQCETLQDLFAKVLVSGTQRLIRRGFHRNYQEKIEDVPALRGRIAFSPSIRGLTWTRGRMTCEFTELSYNTIPNRILKTTLRNLLYCRGISIDNKNGIVSVLHHLHEVESIRISKPIFRRIQYHQNISSYRFLMHVCEFIHDQLLPSETPGESVFRDFLRDEKKMADLFEEFVRNFYRHKTEFNVGRRNYKWEGFEGPDISRQVLPTMKTDVELRDGERLIILDCKYYSQALTAQYDTQKLRSANLYQLFAYLMNGQIRDSRERGHDTPITGMLLYPVVDEAFRHDFTLQGHPVRICTLNLNQPWQDIEQDLLDSVVF